MSTDVTQNKRYQKQHPWLELLSRGALPIAILAVICVGTFISPMFLTIGNFVNILTTMSIVGIIVVGMTFVLIAGGMADLSVPATIATGAILTLALQPFLGPYLAALVAIFFAGLCGLFCGYLVGFLRVNPIIASLGVGTIVLGIVQASVGGVIVYSTDPALGDFLKGKAFGVPIVAIVFFAVVIVGHWVLSYSYWGRWVIATGGNYEAARATGLPVRAIKTGVFVATGVCAGLSGSLLGLTLQQARPFLGTGYEFSAITAVVVGGISIMGGFGSIPRACLGLIFVQILTNVMTLTGVPTPVQGFVLGLLIAIAVAFDIALRRKGIAS